MVFFVKKHFYVFHNMKDFMQKESFLKPFGENFENTTLKEVGDFTMLSNL